MTRAESYDQRVEITEYALRLGKWMSAAELAAATGFSKPTVYSHLRLLKKEGKSIRVRQGESSESGPAPRLYAMKKRA